VARIRTVKPELFRHEGLLDLELKSNLPIRIAFIGLFTVADREGRFEWNPRILKLDILPFDEVDFSRVLDALESREFIRRYSHHGTHNPSLNQKFYGFIPSFGKHQVINNKEGASKLPDPYIDSEIHPANYPIAARKPRVDHALSTPLSLTSGEGKGKGREEERELEGKLTAAHASVTRVNKTPGSKIWEAYSKAFESRYQVSPVRNAKTNSQCTQLAQRLGEDALEVVKFYLSHNDTWYVKRQHDLGSMLQAAESMHSQWQRGQQVTTLSARSVERTQNTFDAFAKHLVPDAESKHE
jgi:hypothetical protein